jgi:ketosteroid isomerase-like protein
MRTVRTTAIAAVVLALAATALAGPARAADPKGELTEIYAKIDKAFAERDADYLVSLYATSFTVTQQDGTTTTREEAASSIRQFVEALVDVESSKTTVDAFEAKGDTFVVSITQAAKGHINGPDGKPHAIDVTAKSRDTWAHGGDGWALMHSDDLGQTVAIDGHAVR